MSGCGSVWLERCVRDAEAGGSNPLTPTIFFAKKMVNEDASLLFTLLCNKSSSLKNEVFLRIFTKLSEALLVKSFHSANAPFHL